jgi:Tetratricopeptide repeat
MAVYPSEDRMRLKRQRSEKAIQLAMQNRWQEAVELNRQIIELFPKDVDSHNRLGKALMELAQYADAREAYGEAARLDPTNTIAAKNLSRLATLAEEQAAAGVATAPSPTPVDPRLFIEESGKTAVTDLLDVPPFEAIAALTAGDALELEIKAGVVQLVTPTAQVVGQLEPKIAQRVTRLTEMGNRYSAAITSIDETHVRIIIREAFRHPSMGSRPSFPTQAPEVRPYTKDSVFRADLDDDDDELLDEVEPDVEGSDVAEASRGDGPLDEEDPTEDR